MGKGKDYTLGQIRPYRLFPSRRLCVVALLFYGSFLMMFNFFTMNTSVSTCMVTVTSGQTFPNGSEKDDTTFGHRVCGHAVENASSSSRLTTLNWDRNEVANIKSGSAWGSLFFVFITGYLCDKYGVKWFYVAALLIYTVTAALIPTAAFKHWIAVFALRFIQGTGVLIGWPALLSTSSKWFPGPERGLLFSLVGSGFLLGSLLANALSGAFCGSDIGWPGTFYLCAILNLICAILWILFYDNNVEDSKYIHPKELIYLQDSLGSSGSSKGRPNTPWKKILTSRCVYAIFGCFFADYYMFYFVGNCMPAYYTDVLGFSAQMTGVLGALPSLLQFVGRLIAGPVSDFTEKILSRTNSTKINTAVAGFIPAVFIMLVSAFNCDTKVGAVICFALAYFFYSFLIGGIFKSLSYVAPSFAGTLTGLGQTIMYSAAIVQPYISAKLIPETEIYNAKDYHIACIVAGAVGIVGTCGYVLLGSGELQDWAKPENLTYPHDNRDIENNHQPKQVFTVMPVDRRLSIDAYVAFQ